MANILIVDDDIYVGNMMEEVLRREGYDVIRAYSGTEAVLVLDGCKTGVSSNTGVGEAGIGNKGADAKAGVGCKAADGKAGTGIRCKPDLVLLDLMLPGLNGEDVLPRIKGIPVIVVSAKADIDNKVDLLLGGAADYITKPFEVKELLARVAVQLRSREREKERENVESKEDEEMLSHIIKFKDITLNDLAHEVDIDGEFVRLTRTEYAILKLLMQNPKQVITKSVMLDRISVDTPDCTESSLKIHVSNLRKKLREASKAASESDYIEAVWGIGFKMRG